MAHTSFLLLSSLICSPRTVSTAVCFMTYPSQKKLPLVLAHSGGDVNFAISLPVFILVLVSTEKADQNSHSLITEAESAPVLWRASFPAWHVQSPQKLYQIQIYTWVWMPWYSPLTSRFPREGTYTSSFSLLLTTFTLTPFCSLSPLTWRGCCNTHTHKCISLERLQGAWVAVLQLKHELGVFWLAEQSFGGEFFFSKEHCLKRVL